MWLSATDPLDTLLFKWKTVENLQWSDLTAAEQAYFDQWNDTGISIRHLCAPIWWVPALEAPYQAGGKETLWLIPRPFPVNFRNTSNA